MTRIILSRTDSIGDVILTLPMAGIIKQFLPGATVLFLCNRYTEPVVAACRHVDQIILWDQIRELPYPEQKAAFRSLKADAIMHVFPSWPIAMLADMAQIPLRIGPAHRLSTWMLCNERVWFSRRRSSLHEAQLNLLLLKPLGIHPSLLPEELFPFFGLDLSRLPEEKIPFTPSSPEHSSSRFRLILHPRSKGSAREWGLENFATLIQMLDPLRFEVILTGTSAEQEALQPLIRQYPDRITDLTGKLTLNGLIRLIGASDGLVAASTGPLHLAAALGKAAIGLYAPMRPLFPTRWRPLGPRAVALVRETPCEECRKTGDCHCIREISPKQVAELLEKMALEKA